jgi:hypothetical protein
MKTTVEIQDALLERARRYSHRTGRPVRSLIEEGLRLVLHSRSNRKKFTLPDFSVGNPEAANPLNLVDWQVLRDEIYGGR